ncbi:MAG: hypothetical protein AAF399_20025 [Bacteroidota bacterium]
MKQMYAPIVLFIKSLHRTSRPIWATMVVSCTALTVWGQAPLRDSLALEPQPDSPEPSLMHLLYKSNPDALAISVLESDSSEDWAMGYQFEEPIPDEPESEPRFLLVYHELPDPEHDLISSLEKGPGVLDKGDVSAQSMDNSHQLFLMAQEGLDAVKFDQMSAGQILLIEDLTENSLIIRIQRMRTGSARMRLFSSEGAVLIDQERRSLGAGFEFTINYQKWPPGTYRLSIELDGHLPSEKIIQKPELINMFH